MAVQRDLFGKHKRFARPSDEQAHCRALMDWAGRQRNLYPELDYLFHVPNGGKRQKEIAIDAKTGEEYEWCPEGNRLKLMGLKPGVPDYFLPVARGDYRGLFIEMKDCDPGKEDQKTSRAQKHWLRFLGEQGYCARPCPSWEHARDLILDYLSWPLWQDR